MRHVLFLALLLASALPLPGQAQEGGDRLSLEALTATPPGGGEARHGYAQHSYARRSLTRHGYTRRSYGRRAVYHGPGRHYGRAPHAYSRRSAGRHAYPAFTHARRHR